MSTNTTSRIAHLEAIHITATADTPLSAATKLEGLKTFNPSTAVTLQETKHLNSEGFSEWEPVWKTASCTLAGECKVGSATQTVLSNALRNGTAVYVSCIDNPEAASGERKGTRYKLHIESGEEPHEAGALVTFNYPCKVSGKPVDIITT